MTVVIVDPEFRSLIPSLSDDERAGLEADIVRDGRATVPLVLWGNLLLDGHNRHEICERHGLPYTTSQAPAWVKDRRDARIWIRNTSLNRRNLGPVTRAALGAGNEEDLAAKAAERQAATRAASRERDEKGRVKPAPPNSGEPVAPAKSTKAREHEREAKRQAAAAVGLKPTTYEAAKVVAARAVPELRAAVDRGDIAVSTGADLCALPAETQRKVAGEGKKAATKAVKAVREEKAAAKHRAKQELAAKLDAAPLPTPKGPFAVIVADPPWRYDKRADDLTHRGRNQYPDMTTEQIARLPVSDMAAKDCVLWLWTTNAFMGDALSLLDGWGFSERTILTWAKDRMGTGDWLRGRTEHCILAIRGRPTVTLTNQTTLLSAPLREHSRKPDEFFDLVDALCHGSKVELFAREPRKGWAAWGAEVDKWA